MSLIKKHITLRVQSFLKVGQLMNYRSHWKARVCAQEAAIIASRFVYPANTRENRLHVDIYLYIPGALSAEHILENFRNVCNQ